MALNPLKLGVAVTNIYAPMHWEKLRKNIKKEKNIRKKS